MLKCLLYRLHTMVNIYMSLVSINCNIIQLIIHLINIYWDRKLCVTGDMNEDISSGDASIPIHSMFTSSSLTQHVTTTHNSGTLMDHLYTFNICLCDVKMEVVDWSFIEKTYVMQEQTWNEFKKADIPPW